MPTKSPRRPRRGGDPPEGSLPPLLPIELHPAPADDPWQGFVLNRFFRGALSPLTGLFTAIPLVIACLLLAIAWRVGPQRLRDTAHLRTLTAHTDGRIVESWLALDWNPARLNWEHHYWRPLATASRCAVVEYGAGGGAPLRRAFCGPRAAYGDSFTLFDLRTLAPGVPFGWARDANGFAVPEMRMSTVAHDWLASHPEPDPMPNDPPTKTALESLRVDHDRPVDLAVAGWTAPAVTVIPLAFAPRDPQSALPAAFVGQALAGPPAWISLVVFLFFFVPGILIWIDVMAYLLARLLGPRRRWALWLAVLVPLVALPWWSARMPRLVGAVNAHAGAIATGLVAALDPLETMAAGAPDAALFAHGERLAWHLDDSLYASTLGRLRFAPPNPPPRSAAAALAALTASVTAQVGALDPVAREAIFVHLRREKEAKLAGAGPVFEDAARQAVLDPGAAPAVRTAAARFLVAWGINPPSAPGGTS